MRPHAYSLKDLRPTLVPDLIRVGNQAADGGYVTTRRQLECTRVLIGLGLSYDWSFEEEFKKARPDIALYCYDYSIGSREYLTAFCSAVLDFFSLKTILGVMIGKRSLRKLFTKPIRELATCAKFMSFFGGKQGISFIKKGVSDHHSSVMITVDEMFAGVRELDALPTNAIFIKMDIEGSEYDILASVLREQVRINGGVIEFHHVKQLWNEFVDLVLLLREDYEIVHVHGNNLGGYIPNTQVPNVIEVSFIKRELLSAEELRALNDRPYPLAAVDRPNEPSLPDLIVSFA